MFVEDLAYTDVSIYLDEHNTEAGESDMAPGIEKLCRAGFVISNAKDVRLDNVQVRGQIGAAIRFNDVDGADVCGCTSEGKLVETTGSRSRNVRIDPRL